MLETRKDAGRATEQPLEDRVLVIQAGPAPVRHQRYAPVRVELAQSLHSPHRASPCGDAQRREAVAVSSVKVKVLLPDEKAGQVGLVVEGGPTQHIGFRHARHSFTRRRGNGEERPAKETPRAPAPGHAGAPRPSSRCRWGTRRGSRRGGGATA